jgi:dTDP-4-dehydrorhamnose reductase
VFDGGKGGYNEQDGTNPINYYGFTKLKGEQSVKSICKDCVIARTSVLYGWHPNRPNFATCVIESLRSRKKIGVANDHYNSPTWAGNLAEMIMSIVENHLTGIYHTAGSERISRYEFAMKVADVFELDSTLINPVKMNDLKTWIAKRPRDSSLRVEKVLRDSKASPLDVNRGLERMKHGHGTG